ncbi:MAG: helix-turn-helix domain-containing protein, partial [Bacteroidota bacterium]
SVLQTRKVSRIGSNQETSLDIRLICATNQPISGNAVDQEIAFRQDLLYRINTVEIQIPSLRERTADIPLLAQHFLEQYAEKYQKKQSSLPDKTTRYLANYSWPGNVRELQHAIERAVILSNKMELQPEDFNLGEATNLSTDKESPKTLDENERNFIKQAPDRHQGNITHTAKELGITRTALYRRLEKFDL